MSVLPAPADPWYQRFSAWLRHRNDLFALMQTMDVECPHDPLSPCVDCDNKARAERW